MFVHCECDECAIVSVRRAWMTNTKMKKKWKNSRLDFIMSEQTNKRNEIWSANIPQRFEEAEEKHSSSLL